MEISKILKSILAWIGLYVKSFERFVLTYFVNVIDWNEPLLYLCPITNVVS